MNKRHSVLMGLCSVLLCICSALFCCLLIVQTTLFNEGYIKNAIQQSGVVGQTIDEKVDSLIPEGTPGEISSALTVKLVEPMENSATDFVIAAVYHPEQTDAVLSQMKQTVTDAINGELSQQSELVQAIVAGSVDQIVNNIMEQVKTIAHYDQLQQLGVMMAGARMPVLISLIASGVVALASLAMLFIIGRRKGAVIAFLVAGLMMGVAAFAGLFFPFDVMTGMESFSSFITSIQNDASLQFGLSALLLIALSIITGIVSLIVGKVGRRGYY